MNLSLSKILFEEVPSLAVMAKEIWYEYYLSIISQDQIDFMLEQFYHREKLQEEWKDGTYFFHINVSEVNGGFLSISEKEKGCFFIHKFYLKKEFRSGGLGTIAFKELINQFPLAKEIRLQVNRKNIPSINFYFKNGFRIEKWADFEIGNGYEMNDFIMVWKRP